MGLSCRISCRACPRRIWRVPRPRQLLWRCLAPSATIGSSRSTRSARCTGGSATCAVDQLESPRRPGCPRGFQQPAQHGRTAQERRERANRPPDHHSPSGCAQPWRRWRPWESRKWAASRPAWRALHSMTSRGCRVDTRSRPQGLQGERQGRQGRKTRVFGLFDRCTTYFGPGSNCNTP